MARDRELRHVAEGRVAWRWSWSDSHWYPWCRVCGRSVHTLVERLIGDGYVSFAQGEHVSTVNVQPTDLAGPYLERYPR